MQAKPIIAFGSVNLQVKTNANTVGIQVSIPSP